ncbi:MAG: tRNA 2-thiocytidine(32) synthetase TtcA [Deltaproteobacteria bacterium]|nr:tRNA 2-thiocytidine(32) synthetase TtcA [Deltaproteobacteria bacterium]MBW2070590.1 tRNA 2-thiocytidine(32) synthetase TtcA [Deltaproteobacteria bacterium]
MRERIKVPYVEKKVRRLLGRAVQRYDLIQANDRILVALSGGTDSTAMLWLLQDRLRHIPIPYEVQAAHIALGFDGEDFSPVRSWVESLGIPCRVLDTNFGLQAHRPENRENPCFLCARLRRAALFKTARRLGCNKIAFGHHMDDLIETFFLNVIYGSQIATMLPRQSFFNGEITVIRPLAILPPEVIRRFHASRGFPAAPNPCPSKNSGKRQEIREILKRLYRQNRKIRGNIFHALHNVTLEYLPSYRG